MEVQVARNAAWQFTTCRRRPRASHGSDASRTPQACQRLRFMDTKEALAGLCSSAPMRRRPLSSLQKLTASWLRVVVMGP